MKLFPESYKKHVTGWHIFFVMLSAMFLLMSITFMLIILIAGHDAFLKDVRSFFGRMVIISIPLSTVTIVLVVYSISSRFHKSQADIYRKKRFETMATDRATMLQSFKHVRYHYPFRTQNVTILTIGGFFSVLAFIFGIYPLGILFVVCTLALSGGVWVAWHWRKDDFVHLTTEGISYCLRGKKDFMPWRAVREIRLTRQGYVIQGDDSSVLISRNIEPVSFTRPNWIKIVIADYRYAKELINHVQQLAPHAYYRQSLLERDIFAKD